nr:MAG TPA: hypothetical protein [Caudoviricetes sp.]
MQRESLRSISPLGAITEKKSVQPSSSKTFPPVLRWGFSLYDGSPYKDAYSN